MDDDDLTHRVAGYDGTVERDSGTPLSVSDLIDQALDIEWYELPGSGIDRAAYALCRLRQAGVKENGLAKEGDDAVRDALAGASHPAVVWLASRAISYMDESGFPEAVEHQFPDNNAD
jgi:hypothetical protein